MLTILALFNGLLWGFLRRWFGGALENYSFWRSRGVQTVAMMMVLLPWFIKPGCGWVCYCFALGITCWLQFVEISAGHGMVFDVSRGGNPEDEKSQNRYKGMWGYKLICKLIPEAYHFGFLFDFSLLTIRYTLPMLPLAVLSWGYVLIGLSVAPIYAFCWALFEHESWIIKKIPSFMRWPTQLAEFLWGFVFGFGIALINS